ncbi:phage distal tail protein [Streptomyces zhihengii]
MPDITLLEGQVDLGGIAIGKGTAVNILEMTGLGRPPVRDNDTDRPSMDGTWAGPDYWAARQIQIDAAIKIPGDGPACEAMLAALQAAAADTALRLTGGSSMPLRVLRPGGVVKRVNGRLRRLDAEYAQVKHGYMPIDVEFIAHDPTWYADTESVVEIPLGWLSGGGFTAPVVAPIVVTSGATAADRPGWVTNAGDSDAWPVIRITGPCSNVTITHADSGRQIRMPGLVLTAGQWMEIDTRPGVVTVTRETGGNASTLVSPGSRIDQFSLPPGRSEMRWTAVDPTNTARMRLTWRDAYIAL